MTPRPVRPDTSVPDPGAARVTLPRRGAAPLRLEARLLDEIGLGRRDDSTEMTLRLWQGKGRLAVELSATGHGTAVRDAASAPGLDGLADWLERVDPWPEDGPCAGGQAGLAARLLEEAERRQRLTDFRWLVGEALYRWHGLAGEARRTLEVAA